MPHSRVHTPFSIPIFSRNGYRFPIAESLTDHIRSLTEEVASLSIKLRATESHLVRLAREKDVTWLESMLDFCKKETDALKQQLYLTRLQKCESEEQSFKAEERAAKYASHLNFRMKSKL